MHILSDIVWFLLKYVFIIVVLVVLVCGAGIQLASMRETDTSEMTSPQNGTYISADDVRLFVQTAGSASDQPLILIHGMAAWGGAWKPVMDHLAANHFYVVAVDMPPFGFSDRPTDHSYWRTNQAKRLNALMKSMRIPSAVIVAHSYGSRSALELAFANPERVKKLILIDPALDSIYGNTPKDSFLSTIEDKVLSIGFLRDGLVSLTITNPLLSKKLIATFMANKEAATDQIVALYRVPSSLKGSTEAFGHWLQGFLGGEDIGLSSYRDSYPRLRVPTALIWGELDSTTPLEQGTQLQQMISGATLSTIPSVGHMPHLEAPETFLQTLDAVVR